MHGLEIANGIHRRRLGGGAGRNTGNVPRREIEKSCRKMMSFPKAIFSHNLSKIRYKLNFSIEFLSKIFKIFSQFPNNLHLSTKVAKN